MFKYIYSLFFSNESEKLRKEIAKKYEKAISYQRNGNIKDYSALISDISKLEDRLVEIQNEKN